MVLFKLIERSLGLVSTLILARLLGPDDFGVVGMALSFIFMAELLMAFGFDTALIQNRAATDAHYNTAWTCNILLGLSVTLLMLALAAPIAQFYRRPDVFWVVLVLALGPVLTGAENIGVVAFRKELDFRREFRFQLTRKVLGFLLVIPLAFALRSYWALVIGILFSRLAGTTISYLMHPYRPRPSLLKVREMLSFSRWILLNNVVGFLKERSSDFFIGRVFGAGSLGSYNIAYELSNLPTTELSAPINRALMPGFAKMESAAEVTSAYAVGLGLMALLALPAAAGIMALAPFLVPVILGAKWLAAVPLMEVLAFNGAVLLFHSSISAVLIGRGHPARTTFANGCYVGLLAIAFAVIGFGWHESGVVAVAYGVLLTSVLATPVYLYQVKRCIGIAPGVFVRAIMRPLLAAALMAVAMRYVVPAYSPAMGMHWTIAWLVGGAAFGVCIYASAAMALWWAAGRPAGAERIVIDRVRAMLAARFGDRSVAPRH
jgi:lipopolysaccharide exporter